MSRINWMEKLGWSEDQLEDIRFTAYSYIRQGKYDIALPFFEALCVLNPDSVYDHQTLGALYLQLNHPEKAKDCLEKAVKMEATHAPTLLNLSKALLMLGHVEAGLRLARMLSKDPETNVSNIAKALLLAYERP